jgi:outer membrane receptor protein involved in Fe transport
MSTRKKARVSGLSRNVLASLTLLFSFISTAAAVSAQDRTDITGRVTDSMTGHAIEAVNVHVGAIQALTNAEGRFILRNAPLGGDLHVERLGYEPVILTAGAATIDVQMVPAPVLLESMVVEALGNAMLALNSSLAVTNVARSDLDASPATSLAEAIDRFEGVSMSRVGSWGSRPSLRGLSGERLEVLIDGNRVNRACTFGMDMGLATVDPATVERVEILSGPGSTAYGSGNVGGVINVVTRHATTDRPLSGELRANGSTAVPGGGFGGTISAASGSYAVIASVDASGYGDYRTPEARVHTSGYKQLTSDVKVDFEPSPAHHASLGVQYYGGLDIGWPMQSGAEIPRESRTSLSLDYGWQHGGDLVDGISSHAYFQKLDHHMVMSMAMTGMNGVPMTSTTDGKSYSETSGGRVQLRLTPFDRVQLDAGSELTRLFAEGTRWTERVMGSMAPVTETYHTWPGVTIMDVGAFVQGDVDLASAVSLTGGARVDRVARRADQGDRKSEWVRTGNVGLRADFATWLSGRASLGFGYRTPDPMELYGLALKPDGFVYRGRADLATETSLSRELTLATTYSSLVASVTGFYNSLENMVLPTAVSDSISGHAVREYQNLGKARLHGVSGTLQVGLPAEFSIQGRATWTHGEDPTTGAPLPAVPPLEGGLTLRRDMSGSIRWTEAEWEGAFRQDRVASSIGEVQTPGWGVLNLRAGAHLAGSDVSLGVENMFDELYRGHLDPYTLYRPGRNFFARVSRSF